MDSEVSEWWRKLSKYLFERLAEASNEEIVEHLREWLIQRKSQVEERVDILAKRLERHDMRQSLLDQCLTPQDMDNRAPELSGLMRESEILSERQRAVEVTLEFMDFDADHLLGTLGHRGLKWPKPSGLPAGSVVDAEVHAAYKVLDNMYPDRESTLSFAERFNNIVQDRKRKAREREEAERLAQDPLPNLNQGFTEATGSTTVQDPERDSTSSHFQTDVNATIVPLPQTTHSSLERCPNRGASSTHNSDTRAPDTRALIATLEAANLDSASTISAPNSTIAEADNPVVRGKGSNSQGNTQTKKRNEARRRAKARERQENQSASGAIDEHGVSGSVDQEDQFTREAAPRQEKLKSAAQGDQPTVTSTTILYSGSARSTDAATFRSDDPVPQVEGTDTQSKTKAKKKNEARKRAKTQKKQVSQSTAGGEAGEENKNAGEEGVVQ